MAAVNRYSTLVAWAKVILPLVALALLSTLFLFARAPDPDAALPFAEIDIEQVTREQRLSRPRFAGTLPDGREIVLLSESAAPIAGAPNRIRLTDVAVEVAVSDSQSLRLQAERGDLDIAAQRADLEGDVALLSSDGFAIRSAHVTLSMADLEISASGPTTIEAPGATLTAGHMRISGQEGALQLHFTDRVHLIYHPRGAD